MDVKEEEALFSDVSIKNLYEWIKKINPYGEFIEKNIKCSTIVVKNISDGDWYFSELKRSETGVNPFIKVREMTNPSNNKKMCRVIDIEEDEYGFKHLTFLFADIYENPGLPDKFMWLLCRGYFSPKSFNIFN